MNHFTPSLDDFLASQIEKLAAEGFCEIVSANEFAAEIEDELSYDLCLIEACAELLLLISRKQMDKAHELWEQKIKPHQRAIAHDLVCYYRDRAVNYLGGAL